MQKINWNQDWNVRELGSDKAWQAVTLPHDAMIGEKRTADSAGIHNIGWFEAKDYEYRKEFMVEESDRDSHMELHFEGVYHNATVYINDREVCFHPYGYTKFAVPMDDYLNYGTVNTVRVTALNSDQPNSRWYSGTGIYRPVWLRKGPKAHIRPYSVSVRTLGIAPAGILVEADASAAGSATVEVISLPTIDKETAVTETRNGCFTGLHEIPAKNPAVLQAEMEFVPQGAGYHASVEIEVPDAELWSPKNPHLYEAIVRFGKDEERVRFGIRTLEYGPQKGLTINGERVLLKGACIHHDNGVLGACAFPEAEERKIRIHLAQGYNALRCAHNPCSEALLEAADRLGMLIMDEYVDCWYIHKTKYDYVNYLKDWWQQDLTDMVEKDRNHPSVIMYSTGNEVAETGEQKGIRMTEEFTAFLHELDPSRPVSCGINIFFNYLYSMGFGVYSDDKAEKESENTKKKKNQPVGSEFYNTLAGIFGDTTMKIGAALHGSDVKTRDAFARMDIAGYNYGLLRYRKDLKKYPNRLILGSETFCKDTWRWYEIAQNNPRIIGDFVWAGMDYIGEAGIGSWEYEQYAPKNAPKEGWLTAGSGRIDILGVPNGEAAYTRVVYGAQTQPAIAVKPLCDMGSHSPSAWKLTEAMESWSWRGYEGKPAKVEVYGRGAKAELLLNGRRVGMKKINRTMRTYFTVPFESGTLEVVTYHEDGSILGRSSLTSADEETKLTLCPESPTADRRGLLFVPILYTDESGILKPTERGVIKVSVENGTLEGLGNACAYNPDGYRQDHTFTYYGRAMAVIRAGESGEVSISVSDGTRDTAIVVPITTR